MLQALALPDVRKQLLHHGLMYIRFISTAHETLLHEPSRVIV